MDRPDTRRAIDTRSSSELAPRPTPLEQAILRVVDEDDEPITRVRGASYSALIAASKEG
jgi:hypothetical protein